MKLTVNKNAQKNIPQGFYYGASSQGRKYPANFYVNNITEKQPVPENYPQNYYMKGNGVNCAYE